MLFSIYRLDGTLVEFRATWYRSQFGPSSTGDRVIRDIDLPITRRKVKRAIGWTMCTFTPITPGLQLSQGDAACSASEPGGYSRQRGRLISFGSALHSAGFKRKERKVLYNQYWGQQRKPTPNAKS